MYQSLRKSKSKKAGSPDGIASVMLKIFAFELAPAAANIYNSSLREGFVTSLLKSAIAHPLRKASPLKSTEDDGFPDMQIS